MKKLIDVYAESDSIVSEVADTYGLRCYWGSSKRYLGATVENSFSILREINIDGYKVILSISAVTWDDKLVSYNVNIINDDKTDCRLFSKNRVIMEITNYIEVVTGDMREGFNYLYENIVYATLDLIGYVEDEHYSKGVNIAQYPDI